MSKQSIFIMLILAATMTGCQGNGLDSELKSLTASVVLPDETDKSETGSEELPTKLTTGPKEMAALIETVIPDLGYNGYVIVSEGIDLVYDENNYYYFKDGKQIGSSSYDKAFPFREGVASVVKDGKYGYINKNGETVIPFIYDKADSFHEGLAYFELADRYGFIDQAGKEVILLDYDSVSSFQESRAYISIEGKYGYIDQTGKVIIEPIYSDSSCFKEGLAKVRSDDKVGVIDLAGNEVLPVIYDWVQIDQGIIKTGSGQLYGCFGYEGKSILPQDCEYIFVNDGYIQFKQKDKWGVVDWDGNCILNPEYDEIEVVPEHNIIKVGQGDKWGIISCSGKDIVPFKYDWIFFGSASEIAVIHQDGKYGLLSLKDYSEVTPLVYDNLSSPINNKAVFQIDDKAGVLDQNGKEVIPPTYDHIYMFDNGFMAFLLNDRYCLADPNGEMLTGFDFEQIEQFGDYFRIKDNYYGIVDQKGQEILPPVYDEMSTYGIYGSSYNPEGCYIGTRTWGPEQIQIKTIIKTSNFESADLSELMFRNEIAPRIKAFHDQTICRLNEEDKNTWEFPGTYIMKEKLLLVSGRKTPILYLYIRPGKRMNFPRSDSGFYSLEEDNVKELVVGYECGGSMRGDEVCLYKDLEKSVIVMGTVGSFGGFGGRVFTHNIYYNPETGLKSDISYTMTQQSVSNYGEETLLEKAGFLYSEEGELHTKDTITDAHVVTEYNVNGKTVVVEHYEEMKKRFRVIEIFD